MTAAPLLVPAAKRTVDPLAPKTVEYGVALAGSEMTPATLLGRAVGLADEDAKGKAVETVESWPSAPVAVKTAVGRPSAPVTVEAPAGIAPAIAVDGAAEPVADATRGEKVTVGPFGPLIV